MRPPILFHILLSVLALLLRFPSSEAREVLPAGKTNELTPTSCISLTHGSAKVNCSSKSVVLFADAHCQAKMAQMSLDSDGVLSGETSWKQLVKSCTSNPKPTPIPSPTPRKQQHKDSASPSHAARAKRMREDAERKRARFARSHQPSPDEIADTFLENLGIERRSISTPTGQCDIIIPGPTQNDDAIYVYNLGAFAVECIGMNITSAMIAELPSNITVLHLINDTLHFLPPSVDVSPFAALGSSMLLLKLKSNKLTVLPPSVFANLTALQHLDISTNLLTTLPPGLFAGLPSLNFLNIGGNPIASLDANVFAGLGRLQYLTLNSMALTLLPPGILSGLVSLTNLNIQNTPLTVIPPNLFASTPLLLQFTLSQTAVTVLPAGLFHSLKFINLNIENNPLLTFVEPGCFFNTSVNQQLYMVNNNISYLAPTSFAGLINTPVITLSQNYLTTLPPGLLATLTTLQSLDVSRNILKWIPAGVFTNQPRMQYIYIESNFITSIPAGCFANMTWLSQLWATQNSIAWIEAGAFEGSEANLTEVQMEMNQITSLPDALFANMPLLQSLVFESNQIQYLPPTLIQNSPSLVFIDFSMNNLTTIPAGFFQGLVNLSTLNLYNNMLNQLPPGVFQNLPLLTTLDLGTNNIILQENMFAGLPRLQQLLLYSNGISVLPTGIFANLPSLTNLGIQTNLFTSIGPDFFTNMKLDQTVFAATYVQASCLGSYCPAYMGGSTLSIRIEGSPITYISKTAIDLLVGHATFQFVSYGAQYNFTSPSCCQLTWMLKAQALSVSSSQIACNGVPLAQISSNCTCKKQTFNSLPSNVSCQLSVNATEYNGVCYVDGCPPGLRAFQTNPQPSILCNDQYSNYYSLYETSCQECLISNCSDCTLSLTGCSKCMPGTFFLAPQPGQQVACVASCSDYGLFYNNVADGTCKTCESASESEIYPANCPLPSSSNSTPIVPIVIPVIGGFMLLAGLALFVWRRMRRRTTALTERLLVTQQEVDRMRKAWEIAWEEITCDEIVGEGAMGQVWRAHWRGMAVAVKVLTGVYLPLDQLRQEMDREATMLQTLRHAHVVQFLGAGTNGEGMPFLVTELMELGALTGLLQAGLRPPPREAHALDPQDWATKRRFAREIAAGMALVHSLGRMHRDLKSGNILATLLHDRVTLKVADFGTVTLAESTRAITRTPEAALRSDQLESVHHTRGVGTLLWMSPEILGGHSYNASADVYSFAVVLWEIAAQKLPWEDVKGSFLASQLLERVSRGERPPVDSRWPVDFSMIMQLCWATNPSSRPSFKSLMTAKAFR
eukprot:m.200429 g.200429  ORF g.200429 m.200429 type:complete len:1299 (+) comp15497_c7_seq3:241-4137(+)